MAGHPRIPLLTWFTAFGLLLTLGQGSAFSAPKKKKKAAEPAATTPVVIQKARAVRTEGPNVLFIIADDLNDWVGWMGGHPQARTPNMDRLAKMGMRFTNAHTAFALCNPSRAALLTGMWPWKSGVSGNEQDWRRSVQVQGRLTLPEYFRQSGFQTAAGGKIFHANHGGPEGRLTGWHGGRRGFEQDAAWDVRYPNEGTQIPDLPVHTGQNYNGLDIWHWDWGGLSVKDDETDDGKVTNWAAKFLQEQSKDSPFFLAVGLYRPHAPWYVPQKYFDMFPLESIKLPEVKTDDLEDIPEIARSKGEQLHKQLLDKKLWPAAVQAYLANIAFCDAMLGRVLEALEQSAHKDSTVIVFTSDHGWYLGEKEKWHKGGLWEEATRIPLVIVAPKITQPDTVSNQPVSLVDLYPTLCDLAAMPKPAHLDGESLLPLLKDPTLKRDRPAITTSGGEGKAAYAIRSERWRLIRYANGAQELYDHETDPHEWNNLVEKPEHSSELAQLANFLPQTWASASRPLTAIKVDSSADGAVTYWLQAGDHLPQEAAPNVTGRGIDVEAVFDYKPDVDADSTLLSQGNSRLGYALHLIGGRPAFTVNYDGLRTTLKAKQVLPAGPVTLRALMGLDGTLALGVAGSDEEVKGFAPMEGGFPRQPEGPLAGGESFGPLPVSLFPDSTPFDGHVTRLNLQLLPGLTEESRAVKAMPVE